MLELAETRCSPKRHVQIIRVGGKVVIDHIRSRSDFWNTLERVLVD
jgi:hypothetical protein